MLLSKFQLFVSAVLFSLVAVPAYGGEPDSNDRWWQSFNDPILDTLITRGLDANYDVATAVYRMQAAQSQIDAARAAYWPQVGVQTGYTHARSAGATSNGWNTGASIQWQIDLFGRVNAQVNSARAGYRASAADTYAAQLSMAAQIAQSYIDLRMAQAQQQVALAHISRSDTIAQIAKTRFECGLAAKIDVDQALIALYSTRAALPGLNSQIHADINALAFLTASTPQAIKAIVDPARPMPEFRALVATDVPTDLLRRRPDVLAAEAAVGQAAAQLGIARKDYLPTLSLNGTLGWANRGSKPQFDSNALTYSIAPTLSWTVFDGMARRANTAASRSQLEAAVSQYNRAVANAFTEADNAISTYTNALSSVIDYQLAMQSASEFLQLSLDLYTQGISDFTNVANAQQSYLQYANSTIAAHGKALSNLINLYQALGGATY